MKRITAIALCVGLIGFAGTAQAKGWETGYQNGDNVYTAKLANKVNDVTLYCHGEDTDQSFFLGGNGPGPIAAGASTDPATKMVVVVDGRQFAAPFAGTSYASQADYKAFWETFRSAKSITILANGKEYKVPTEGLKAALPAYDSPDFECGLTTN